MKFLTMHKVDATMEHEVPPDAAMLERMGAFMGEVGGSGKMLGGEGLRPSKTRTRFTFRNGDAQEERGPFTGRNEVIAGMVLLTVKTHEEAVAWVKRFADVVGDTEIELGPVTEPWDLGFGPKPADAPLRVLCLQKANAFTESGAALPDDKAEAMRVLLVDMKRAGVLGGAARTAPSRQASRLFYKSGKRTVVDGPFAESKELIAGYAVMNLSGKSEVLEMSDRFAAVLQTDLESDAFPVEIVDVANVEAGTPWSKRW